MFLGAKSDFDDVFVYENVIVFVEYTIRQESNVSEHLKNKKIVYDKITSDPRGFIELIRNQFPAFNSTLGDKYQAHQYRVKILYCSLHAVKTETKSLVPNVVYYDYNVARYFDVVSKTVRKSARYELFDFLGLKYNDIAEGVLSPKVGGATRYPGSILPESHSNFGEGFKVVSFYVDPSALLQRAYVLRKYGWRAGETVYQRMISQTKVAAVRKYLKDEKRVFINNIIVTLPDDTKLLNEKEDTIDPKDIMETQPGIIQIPDRFNTIGIVDGQHRVFSYHEGGNYEGDIAKLRVQQNLLVTGVIFPKAMKDEERLKFEATLFLEINSNQTNAKSDLKQEINLVINPFAPESIAKRVVNHMNDVTGPLQDEFERFFFDKDKLKTTSVVSFAVRFLVNPQNDRSLISVWNEPNKSEVQDGTNHTLLAEYVRFCASSINHIFAAIRASLPPERWTADRKVAGRFLTTTNVNGVIACLRKITQEGKTFSVDEYRTKLKGIETFQFDKYKSSQYNRMGDELYKRYFS